MRYLALLGPTRAIIDGRIGIKLSPKHGVMFVFTFVLLVAFTLLSGCGNSSTPTQSNPQQSPVKETTKAPEPVSIKVAYSAVSAMQAIPWICLDSGLFEKQGLKVELINASSNTAIQALLAGEMQLAQSPQEGSVQAAVQGADTVIISTILDKALYSYVVNPKIKTPADLKGKKLGITSPGGTPAALTKRALKKWGLDPEKDVALIQLKDMGLLAAGLAAGSIDGAAISVPNNLKAKSQGFVELLDMATLDDPSIGGSMVTTRKYISEHRDIVKRYMKAYIEGIHKYLADPQFSMDVIKRWTQTDDMEDVKGAYEVQAKYILKVPRTSIEGVRVILDGLAADVPGANAADPKKFIDTRIVDELEQEGFISQLYR